MALFDFADVVAAFDPEDIVIKRYGAATHANGYATRPAPSDIDAKAVIWPTTGAELRLLPEGMRVQEARTLVTTTPLKYALESNAAHADRFDYDGATWEIQTVAAWAVKAGYYLGIATRLEN